MSLKKKTFIGLIWTFSNNFGRIGIRFLTQIFLARLIIPEEFGLFGMIGVFYGIAEALTNTGMSASVIRMKNPLKEDYSTIFYSTIFISIIIYIGIYILAPFIGEFYNEPILINIIRVYALGIVIGSLYSTHVTKLTKSLNFKKQALIVLPSLIISSIVGIYLGYLNYGIWALVYMQLVQVTALCIQYWFTGVFIPDLNFNFRKLKFHFNFGYKILLNSLLNNIFINIYPLIIGRYNSPDQVGYYSRSLGLRNMPMSVISGTFNQVTFPVLVEVKSNTQNFIKIFKKFLKVITLLVCFVMGLLSVSSKPLIIILITETWLPSVPYLQLICVGGIFTPISYFYITSFNALGKSEITLKSTLISRILNLIVLGFTFKYSVFVIIFGQVISEFLNLFLNQFFLKREVSYTLYEQFKDFLKIFFPTFIIIVFILFINSVYFQTITNNYLLFLTNFLIYLILFLGIQLLLNKEIFYEIYNLRFYIIEKFNNRK